MSREKNNESSSSDESGPDWIILVNCTPYSTGLINYCVITSLLKKKNTPKI